MVDAPGGAATVSQVTCPYALVPAAYVYLCGENEVLLQRRQNTGYMDGHWVAGAAGHLDPGETAVAAAVREVAEELGVRVRPGDLHLLTVMQRTDGTDTPTEQRVDWFWRARHWEGQPQILEPAKCAALAWFPLDQLPEPMPAYERRVIEAMAGGGLPGATSYGFGSD